MNLIDQEEYAKYQVSITFFKQVLPKTSKINHFFNSVKKEISQQAKSASNNTIWKSERPDRAHKTKAYLHKQYVQKT
jgi:hypothetical protein